MAAEAALRRAKRCNVRAELGFIRADPGYVSRTKLISFHASRLTGMGGVKILQAVLASHAAVRRTIGSASLYCLHIISLSSVASSPGVSSFSLPATATEPARGVSLLQLG